MSTQLKDLAATAAQIIAFAVPIIKVAVPGSPAALAVAKALEVAGEYLQFANKLADKHLTELASDLVAIKADVEAMSKAGDNVPAAKWAAVATKIDSSTARIKAAMGR